MQQEPTGRHETSGPGNHGLIDLKGFQDSRKVKVSITTLIETIHFNIWNSLHILSEIGARRVYSLFARFTTRAIIESLTGG